MGGEETSFYSFHIIISILHEFRYGHIHWGRLRARTPAQDKAVSMNVMHSNTKITDEIYSKLNDEDQDR